MNESEIKKRIDQYIDGELTDIQIDELWIEFLKSPEWFEYYQRRERILKVLRILKLKRIFKTV